jgi:hypothetical protein
MFLPLIELGPEWGNCKGICQRRGKKLLRACYSNQNAFNSPGSAGSPGYQMLQKVEFPLQTLGRHSDLGHQPLKLPELFSVCVSREFIPTSLKVQQSFLQNDPEIL